MVKTYKRLLNRFTTSVSSFKVPPHEVNRLRLASNKVISSIDRQLSVSPYRWVMLFLAWLIYFSFGMIGISMSPLLTLIIQDLNLTYSQAGAIMGAWQLTYIGAALIVGLLTDRVGTRISLAFGAMIISISAALRGFATSFETMFIAVAIFGIGGPIISIGLPKLVASWFLGKERGTAMGICITGSRAGNSVSLAIANSVLLPFAGTWRNALRLYAVFGFMILIIWVLAGRKPSDAGKQKSSLSQSRSSSVLKIMPKLLRHRNIWVAVIVGISFFLITHGLRSWLPKILESEGISSVDAGFVASIFTLFNISGNLIIPRLSYHIGSRKNLIILTLLLGGVSTFMIGTTLGIPFWLGLITYGLTYAGFHSLMMVFLMELPEVGSKYMGSVTGIYFTFGEMGGFAGPFLLGYLRDLTGSFFAGVVMLSVITETMVPLTFLIRERPAK